MKETIFTWGQLADCIQHAESLAAPCTVPIGTMETEKHGEPGAEIVRVTITIDLVPRQP